jgi:uncharacterized membrane protein YkvI
VFHVLFQLMIFAALLESGTGGIHAVNERVAQAWRTRTGRALSTRARLTLAGVLIVVAMFLAERFGLVTLIARGYRLLAYVLIAVYLLPLLSIGVWRMTGGRRAAPAQA